MGEDCLLAVKQLLSEIYNGVEEPDGLYGVPLGRHTRQVLLQRLQHEKDWSQAFNYRGAEFESGSEYQNAVAVAESLQALGLNKLAASFLQEVSSGNSVIPMDLAWRTQQWDVPIDSGHSDPNQSEVYRAMRAVHLLREPEQAWNIARLALQDTMKRFAETNVEDLAGIRRMARTLLCLREVDLWYSTYLPLMDKERFLDPLWEDFTSLPANIESVILTWSVDTVYACTSSLDHMRF